MVLVLFQIYFLGLTILVVYLISFLFQSFPSQVEFLVWAFDDPSSYPIQVSGAKVHCAYNIHNFLSLHLINLHLHFSVFSYSSYKRYFQSYIRPLSYPRPHFFINVCLSHTPPFSSEVEGYDNGILNWNF